MKVRDGWARSLSDLLNARRRRAQTGHARNRERLRLPGANRTLHILTGRLGDAEGWSGVGRHGEYLPVAGDANEVMTASVVERYAALGVLAEGAVIGGTASSPIPWSGVVFGAIVEVREEGGVAFAPHFEA